MHQWEREISMLRLRRAAVLTVFAVVASACGARMTDEQIAFGRAQQGTAGAVAGDGTATGGSGAGTGTTDDGTTTGGGTAGGTGSGGTGTTGGATDAGSGGTGTTGGAGTGGTGSTDGGTDTGTGGSADGGSTATDTRNAPPGGNGGATDIGVTETEIRIVNVADVGGALPGLMEDARDAITAYVAYFTATEGTIYGRQLKLEVKDSAIDDGQNRNHYVNACENHFAAVASMSANDGGAAGPIADCGIPDLRTAAVNEAIQTVDTVFGIDAMKPGVLPTSEYNYWAEQHPDAVKNAAYLYVDNATTKYQGEQNRGGTEKVGYDWTYVKAIGLAETNYSTYVIEMQDAGIQFVTIQGAVSNAVRLAKAMRQQGFEPAVYALQTNVYNPDLIAQGGADIEGAQVAVTGSLVEEIAQVPEMQLYAEWLARVDSSKRPTGLGMYAWSAGRLFTDLLKKVGPELTREKFLAELAAVRGFSNNDLIPPQDVGTKIPADCIIIVEVSGGAFKRVEPASGPGFRCDNKVVSTS